MIDGMSGVDIMKVLMSLTPEYDEHDAPAFIPRPSPSSLELWRHEMMRWASLPLRALTGIGIVVRAAQDARRDVITTARAAAHMVGTSLRRPSLTPLNAEIGPHRRFEWLTLDLSDIKVIRKGLGGSLNDIVLTIVTGAVRRLLQSRQVRPEGLDFRILAPVSVRAESEQGALGNRVSAWLVDLPVGEKDPLRQLEKIRECTTALKDSKDAVGAEVLTQVAEWTPSTLLSLAGRNASRMLPFNMVVTNVPGPQVPMYMFGARMRECYPHVPLTDYLGLGIALLSCDGKLCWGFNADYDLMPDLAAFVGTVKEVFKDLLRLAMTAAAERAAAGVAAASPAPATAVAGQPSVTVQSGNGDVRLGPANPATAKPSH
jgi:WS/DGAT/MGAT family acyltransferase